MFVRRVNDGSGCGDVDLSVTSGSELDRIGREQFVGGAEELVADALSGHSLP